MPEIFLIRMSILDDRFEVLSMEVHLDKPGHTQECIQLTGGDQLTGGGRWRWLSIVTLPCRIVAVLKVVAKEGKDSTSVFYSRIIFSSSLAITEKGEGFREFEPGELLTYGLGDSPDTIRGYPKDSFEFEMEILPSVRVDLRVDRLNNCRTIPQFKSKRITEETSSLPYPMHLSQPNTISTDRPIYICQPGDHSGDTWAIAAALILNSRLRLIITTRPGSGSTTNTRQRIVFTGFSSKCDKITPNDIQTLRVDSDNLSCNLGTNINENPDCEFEGLVNVTLTAVLEVRGDSPLTSTDQYILQKTSKPFPPKTSGGSIVLHLEATHPTKRTLTNNKRRKTPDKPIPNIKVTLTYEVRDTSFTSQLALDTISKFLLKFNQATEFYSAIGIERTRIKVIKDVEAGRNWTESFNMGIKHLNGKGRGTRQYGMTWASTSIIMDAAERNGIHHAQERMRTAFTTGLSAITENYINLKLNFIDLDCKYLFVNMRYATHNKEHNIASSTYDQILKHARRFGRKVVRVGIPQVRSQRTGRDWMRALKEPAIDIYDVNQTDSDSPIEVDMRRTAYFWKRVADLGNIWVIGGRSGSLDIACFMGVRGFSWDIIARPIGVEQTEYARLWMAHPFMSVGSLRQDRSDSKPLLDSAPLLAWLGGLDVIPSSRPPDLPFQLVETAAAAHKRHPNLKHNLLFGHLDYLLDVGPKLDRDREQKRKREQEQEQEPQKQEQRQRQKQRQRQRQRQRQKPKPLATQPKRKPNDS